MLKIRIIPTLLHKGLGLVKGVGFNSWRRVGSALQSIKVYSLRGVDELLFLDISATPENRPPDFSTIDDLADECFMPLAVGGGVRSVEDVRRMLLVGADKVVVNSAAVYDEGLVHEAAKRFGAQCIVVSIDYRQHADGSREVFAHCGTRATGLDAVLFARRMADAGAGEILLTSIERDGAMNGYDIEGIAKVAEAVGVPVIASGGAGSYEDMYLAITQGGAAAVAAASIYHFTEMTPREAKVYLHGKGVAVRMNNNT
ncbi:imidazole glycerol phosphate synthase subunit HisF [Desulfonatronum thiodismutans]|uniref:imidazole glycerol phosphate synthase subunit HisF n=1 Tax=Desulfonatronum thiodismutans TaxID=159290 RepID=UPI0004ABD9DB|nr:imidazole glycerol phosphate synthase cyclase subunit [Desulfonatronum thiodismutans]